MSKAVSRTCLSNPVVHRPLLLELLEERIAPAGNVIVTASGGNLTLTGDAESNEFMVEHFGADPYQVRVTPGAGTTLNGGAADLVFSSVYGMKMTLGDGDDDVVLNGVALTKDVVIDTGGGDNSVTVTSSSTIGGALTMKSSAASSQDYLEINGSEILHNVSLTGKAGGQTVNIAGSYIGGSLSMKAADLSQNSGYNLLNSTVSGSVSLAIAKGYHVLGSDPDDSIPFTIRGCQVGSVSMQAKAGDYDFVFNDSATSQAKKGGISVTYGAGDSYTFITGDSTVYGSVSVKTGTKYSWLDRLLNLAWETEFTLEDSTICGKLAVSNLESDDSVTVHASHIYQGATVANGTGDADVFFGYVLMRPDGGKACPLKVTSSMNGWGFEDDVVSVTLDEVFASTVTVSAPQTSQFVLWDVNATIATVVTGGHDDSVYLANVDTSGNLTVKTGSGDDTVMVTKHSSPHGTFTLDTGAGNDTVGLDNEAHGDASDYYGNVKVTLGAGDDHLTLGIGGVDGNVGRYWKASVFDGGAGTDSMVYVLNGNIFESAQPVIVNFESVT